MGKVQPAVFPNRMRAVALSASGHGRQRRAASTRQAGRSTPVISWHLPSQTHGKVSSGLQKNSSCPGIKTELLLFKYQDCRFRFIFRLHGQPADLNSGFPNTTIRVGVRAAGVIVTPRYWDVLVNTCWLIRMHSHENRHQGRGGQYALQPDRPLAHLAHLERDISSRPW